MTILKLKQVNEILLNFQEYKAKIKNVNIDNSTTEILKLYKSILLTQDK